MLFSIFNGSQNTHSIQKLLVVLIPGLTSTVLSLPPLPTSATSNLNIPIPIRLSWDPELTLSDPSDISTLTRKKPRYSMTAFRSSHAPSHACPTRTPGDAIRIHSVLTTFIQTPVSGEENKRRIKERISGSCFVIVFPTRTAYLHRSGEHEEQEPGTVPLKCRVNGSE